MHSVLNARIAAKVVSEPMTDCEFAGIPVDSLWAVDTPRVDRGFRVPMSHPGSEVPEWTGAMHMTVSEQELPADCHFTRGEPCVTGAMVRAHFAGSSSVASIRQISEVMLQGQWMQFAIKYADDAEWRESPAQFVHQPAVRFRQTGEYPRDSRVGLILGAFQIDAHDGTSQTYLLVRTLAFESQACVPEIGFRNAPGRIAGRWERLKFIQGSHTGVGLGPGHEVVPFQSVYGRAAMIPDFQNWDQPDEEGRVVSHPVPPPEAVLRVAAHLATEGVEVDASVLVWDGLLPVGGLPGGHRSSHVYVLGHCEYC